MGRGFISILSLPPLCFLNVLIMFSFILILFDVFLLQIFILIFIRTRILKLCLINKWGKHKNIILCCNHSLICDFINALLVLFFLLNVTNVMIILYGESSFQQFQSSTYLLLSSKLCQLNPSETLH